MPEIRYVCLVMSENYIRAHFDLIKKYASVIEERLDDDCTPETLISDNAEVLRQCQKHRQNYLLIDKEYKADIEL